MARTHAVLLLRVWADPEWRSLPRDCQWLYELLISQPTINHAGVLPLPGRRWSALAADATPDVVNSALKTLEQRRFIAFDEDTEEVLVRSFVRNDGVHRSPNTLKSALRSAQSIQSARLRAVLVRELRRLDVSGMRVPKGHEPIEALLRATLDLLDQDPETPPPGTAIATPSEGYGEPITEPYADGYGVPRGEGEGEGVSSRSPIERKSPRSTQLGNSATERARDRAGPAHTAASHRLVETYGAACTRRPPRKILNALAVEVDALLAEDWPAADIERALATWGTKALGPGALQAVAHEVVNRRAAPTRSRTSEAVASVDAAFDEWHARHPTGDSNVFALPPARRTEGA